MELPPLVRSRVAGIGWPGLPGPREAALLAVDAQLQDSQWWSADQLSLVQLRQLELLLRHARRSTFWNERLGSVTDLTEEAWRRIPVLQRADVQRAGAALQALPLPEGHGRVREAHTSGSTGRPLTTWVSEAWILMNHAVRLRNHRWHRRSFRGTYADIRVLDGIRARAGGWVPAYGSGPHLLFDVREKAQAQWRWLMESKPTYLLTHPSNLDGLLTWSRGCGERLSDLAEVETFGEVLRPAVRDRCTRQWGVPVVDVYSAVEAGTLALQCPDAPGYHIQSERVRVEVLRDDGAPCSPGEVGLVVVTPLHALAAPLVRYALGDYAEAGGPCPCGRGLPTIRRILGRPRNRLRLPSGERIWPTHPDALAEVPGLMQFRLVQRGGTVLVEVVAEAEVDLARIGEEVRSSLGHPFQVDVVRVDAIPIGAGGKRDDLIGEG